MDRRRRMMAFRLRLALLGGVLIVLLGRPGMAADTSRLYDAQGRYQGRAECSHGMIRYFDAQGRPKGSKRSEDGNCP